MPNGKFKAYPALVISNSNVLETEDIFYAVMISSNPMNEEFNFELDNAMLAKPLSKKSFIKCQLIQSYTTNEVISKISLLNQISFDKVLKKILKPYLNHFYSYKAIKPLLAFRLCLLHRSVRFYNQLLFYHMNLLSVRPKNTGTSETLAPVTEMYFDSVKVKEQTLNYYLHADIIEA